MKKLVLMLLVLSLVFALASCKKECKEHVDENNDGKCDVCEKDVEKAPCTAHVDANNDGKCDNCGADVTPEPPAGDGVMTYAEFSAAALDSEVTVITYVQAKQGHWKNDGVDVATFYTQAPDGAYFLYDMPCSAEEYEALVPGTCIKVTGYKAEWSGEVEIVDATFEILADKAAWIAPALDITADIAAGNDVIAHQNKLIAIKDAVVAAAPMYKWDGSGSAGDDIYLTVTVGTKSITLVVESYLHGNGSLVYEEVENLTVGETIDIEAFLYWYNGAQPHINMADNGITSHLEFDAAELNDEVTVITFVQAKQGHWNNDGVDVATFYTQAPDGAYFLYDMPCSAEEYEALVPGTCIKVTGYKAEWSGEVEIVDATFEILADKAAWIAPALDITADIAAGNDVIAHQNKLIAIKDAVVAAAPMYKWDGSGSAGDDIYLTVTVGTKTLTLVVESYLHGNGSAVYEAVEALEVGATVSFDAFLYWYNGAQPHINAVR